MSLALQSLIQSGKVRIWTKILCATAQVNVKKHLINDQDEKKAQTNGQCQDPFCILILKGIVKTSKHGGNLIFENFGF